MIRALIADDEAIARSRLRKLLREHDDIAVVGEAAGGREAVDAVRRHGPDLLFLDIQMPGVSGFGVLEALLADAARLPAVIFVTAYDEYAIRAFEVQAVDYLLKPFDDARFHQALEHARQRLRQERSEELRQRFAALLDERGEAASGRAGDTAPSRASEPEEPPLIPVHRRGRIVLVEVPDIDWIEAAGDYVRLHVGDDTHLVRTSMSDIKEKVGEAFLRIHRSAIVRRDAVRELSPRTHGDYDVVLEDGTQLRLSRSYRDEVSEVLGIEL